jgi:parallel beta-helix repeat protein
MSVDSTRAVGAERVRSASHDASELDAMLKSAMKALIRALEAFLKDDTKMQASGSAGKGGSQAPRKPNEATPTEGKPTPDAASAAHPAADSQKVRSGGEGGAAGAPATAGRPPNSLDVTQFGAVGDGKTDNTAALQKAFDAAKASGQTVYISAGTFNHRGPLTADGVKVTGAGDKAVLNATDPNHSAVRLTGDGASLSNVKVQTLQASERSSQPDAAGVLVQNATNASVTNVTVNGAGSNGIRLDNADRATIDSNLVQSTNADGIALMNGSSNNRVTNNCVHQAGDDAFSDNSYVGDAEQDSNNTFDHNTVLDSQYGRGFALMGSRNDTVTNNTIAGVPGAGIMAGTDANSATLQGSGAQISGNQIINEFDASAGRNTQLHTPEAVKKSIAGSYGLHALVDRSEINTLNAPGTGNGANNQNGQR